MKKNVLYQFALISAGIGLAIIFAVILSGTAYPHIFFRIGAPLGLVFIFISVILLFISWLWEVHSELKAKRYLWAIIIAVFGLLILVQALVRIM